MDASPSSASPAAPGLSQRLTLILEGLCRAAAAGAAKDRAAAVVVLLLWPYLNRLAARFARLMTRPRSGHPTVPRPRQTRGGSARLGRLPTHFAWLLRLAPEVAAFAAQLQHLLASQEAAALLAASPQAARMLRPLCRMLGRGPDELPALFRPHVQAPLAKSNEPPIPTYEPPRPRQPAADHPFEAWSIPLPA